MDENANKKSKTSEQSPSHAANENRGYNETLYRYRSILTHPFGIPLLIYLTYGEPLEIYRNHLNDSEELPEYVRNALNDFVSDDLGNIFANAALAWEKGSEKVLTEHLLTHINAAGERCNNALLQHAEGEKEVTGSEGTGKVDLMFLEASNSDDGKKSVVAVFEFGFEGQYWWKKQDQLLIYASMIRKNLNKNYKIDQPILLSVITINKKDCNNFTKDTPIGDINLGARFGVFLYVPKGDNGEFRITLLWRTETANLSETSCQFGKVINAVKLCGYLRNYWATYGNTIDFEYLGPNCSRIGDTLYRAYDTRLRPTERRSDLYLEPNVFGNPCDAIAKSVFKIADQMPIERPQIGSAIDWLWDYKGELFVISTTYHDGVHYATDPLHFLPIIKHLENLHSQGFVHGDIRAYNMVLPREAEKADEGWLIDFDYGGKVNSVTYPKGYKRVLADGVRTGEAGQQITIMDDWQSLFGLLLHKYDFLPKNGGEYRYEYEVKLRQQLTIYYKIESATAETNNEVLLWVYPASLLREYLALISKGYTIEPEQSFKKDMKDCGLWNNPNRIGKNASGAATGSPKKDN